MSHVTDVQVRIEDLDALEEACEKLGLELQRGKRTYAWWGNYVGDSRDYGEHQPAEMGRCEHAIKVRGDSPQMGSGGPWEIGVIKATDGPGFRLYYDKFGGAGARLSAKVGPGANIIRREYAAAVATRKANRTLGRDGWTVQRDDLEDGAIRLKLRRR